MELPTFPSNVADEEHMFSTEKEHSYHTVRVLKKKQWRRNVTVRLANAAGASLKTSAEAPLKIDCIQV